MEKYTRLFDIVEFQLATYPQEICIASNHNDAWVTYSTQQLIDESNQLARSFISMGVQPGDKIGVITDANRVEWSVLDLAILKVGAVNVPMYPTISQNEFTYIFNDASVKYTFVSNQDLFQKIVAIQNEVPSLLDIYTFDEVAGAKHWKELLLKANQVDQEQVEQRKQAISPKDLATLIYTSGTTGTPKGVMLSHENICENTRATVKDLPIYPGQTVISCLPICHVFERMVIYSYMSKGVNVYFCPIYDADGNSVLGDYIREVKPEVFTTVPRILEKVFDKIVNKGLDLKGIKKAMFFWALNLGFAYDWRKSGGFFYNLQLKLANKLIFSKWREALGGRVTSIVSGSAPLQERLTRVFSAAQIDIREGYGLTETSPVLTYNRFDSTNAMIGTVGIPLENVEIKIAEDGEILAKGPNIMMGYYNQPEKTAEVFTADGWFKTGDIGELVEGKFLKITDRKKQLMKTSGGKYVAPTPIEEKCKESLLIEQMMVVAEGKKFVSALIVPTFSNLADWAKLQGVTGLSNEELIQNKVIIQKIQEIIQEMNENFSHVEQIKQFKLLPKEFTIEAGELTPTMKLKRKNILENYQNEIKSIYNEN